VGSIQLSQKSLSRSTSASSQGEKDCKASPEHSKAATVSRKGLPTFDYPIPALLEASNQLTDGAVSPLVVRNTFLEPEDNVNSSFLDDFSERKVKSCPTSGVSMFPPPDHKNLSSAAETETGATEGDWEPSPTGLPDMDYPAPFDIPRGSDGLPDLCNAAWAPMRVRNTFLDISAEQGSFVEFLPTRQAQSCPTSRIHSAVGSAIGSSVASKIEHEDEHFEMSDGLNQATQDTAAADIPASAPVLSTSPVKMAPPPGIFFHEPELPPPPSHPPSIGMPFLMESATPPPPLQAPFEAELQLGSAALPSVGSMGHRLGNCKPCAFLFTKGCQSGVQCVYCHLCLPGEKKRRQKLKNAVSRLCKSGIDPNVALATAMEWSAQSAAEAALNCTRPQA